MQSRGSLRPSLSQKASSRRLVDFDSEQLLSMEEIGDNVRLQASRLLNDEDLSSLEDENEEDQHHHDQLPSVEEARSFAGLLLKKPSPKPKKHSLRNLINAHKSIRAMQHGTSNDTFASSMDAMSMELDMHVEEIPTKRGLSQCQVYCVVATTAIALLVAIIVALSTSGSDASSPAPAPQAPITPQMEVTIDILTRNGVSDPEALTTLGTPQQQAVDWISNTDAAQYNATGEDEARFIQRYVMAVFYYALGGPEWKHQVNFLEPEDECSWFLERPVDKVDDVYSVGVTCNAYSQVETILLPGNNLKGSLPSELSLLTGLDFVSLKHNQVNGSIPDSFQSLTDLEYFDLQYNQLTGELPSWMGDTMEELRSLSLSDNQFQGKLPQSMSRMSHLKLLALDDNTFTGDMASVVNSMITLKYLYVDNNAFDSMMDSSFLAELDQLEEADLSGNEFASNDLPPHLFLKRHLRVLDLHGNDLAGTLPDEIPEQQTLEFLSLCHNRLSGSIPPTIHQLSSLTHLDLSSNQLSGMIPQSISTLSDLTYLFLSDNSFEASSLPESFMELESLEDLSLSNTQLTGALPQWLGTLSQLVLIDVSMNELTGAVPDSVWDLPNLKYFLIHRNLLTGRVSDGLMRADNLDLFASDKNDFMDDFSGVCNRDLVPGFMSADCGGDFQQVYCTCCVVCCQDDDPECNDDLVYGNLDARWEANFTRTAYDFGPNHIYQNDETFSGDGLDNHGTVPENEVEKDIEKHTPDTDEGGDDDDDADADEGGGADLSAGDTTTDDTVDFWLDNDIDNGGGDDTDEGGDDDADTDSDEGGGAGLSAGDTDTDDTVDFWIDEDKNDDGGGDDAVVFGGGRHLLRS